MGDRIVVYSAAPDSEAVDSVAARMRARGVEIIEKQPHMLLLDGAAEAISHIIDDIKGWKLTAETKVAPPDTREKILKPPTT